ncbi:MAG: alpha/beta hydrolase domain-containing protein [Pseudomonadota bacterium]
MPVERLQILHSVPYASGREFGEAGAYQRVDAIAWYAVDPDHEANAGIVDLKLADRDPDGLVRFSGDVTLLYPVRPAAANGALLVEVPNRGRRTSFRSFNHAPIVEAPTYDIQAGDGYLLQHGWCVAWVGWQWDMPLCVERLGLRAPLVPNERLWSNSVMQLRLQPDRQTAQFALTDHHVGAIGHHAPIPPRDAEDPDARLLVRPSQTAEPETVDPARWRFVPDVYGEFTQVTLDGGFEPGRIYDLLYTPRDCPVVGSGLLAVRDFAAFARDDDASPVSNRVTHTIGHGISQCGRFLRTLMHLGLNVDERGRQVYDGLQVHVAGARRGEFNARYGQPSVQPTPNFGHLFPFADEPQTNPQTGETAGLLDRLRARGVMPKVVYTDTSAEYWRGDAGLAHLNLADGTDAEPPEDVRRYLFASTQHGPGVLPYKDTGVFGSRGANLFNTVDYRPLLRATLENLREWVQNGAAPPDSCFPRVADGTATTRAEAIGKLAGSGLCLPDPDELLWVRPLDLGPEHGFGVGQYPAQFAGNPYGTVVSEVDANGNETGGLRMPDVTLPVGTHTGFDPRHAETGGAGQILEYVGSSLPRADLLGAAGARADYLANIRELTTQLITQRHVLPGDLELCVQLAAARYDAAARWVDKRTDSFKPTAVGINHVALEVGDIDAALDFYGAFIDFRISHRSERAAFIYFGDQFINFSLGRNQSPDENRHFGIAVDDKPATQARLEAMGITFLDSRFLDFLDPWGNRVEITTYTNIQFSKADGVLRGMGLEHLEKSDAAKLELGKYGFLP